MALFQFFPLFSCFIFGIVVAFGDLESCGRLFVNDVVIIDASSRGNCNWQIHTEENRILAISMVNGNLEQVQEFLAIHDGFGQDSPILSLENQVLSEISRKDLPKTIYTTQSSAEVRLKKSPTSPFQLKIAKAVNCPFNLGAESQCGRVVDDASCYCATFTKRDQPSQTKYCKDYGMLLLSLESQAEDQAVLAAWGTATTFMTSGSDLQQERTWIWESTNKPIYPGYANWGSTQPDNARGNENCLNLNYPQQGRWNDCPCNTTMDAICEAHP